MKRMNEVFELPVGGVDIQGKYIYESQTENDRLVDDAIAHAINNVDALADILDEALLQIAYLQNKFGDTGSGNSVLSRGQSALDEYRGTK